MSTSPGREGFTTGTCAAAAAKAAVLALCGKPSASSVSIELPEGTRVDVPVSYSGLTHETPPRGEARVCKDAGDDPDITHGSTISVHAAWSEGDELLFEAGEGIGTVTRPGLSLPVGEPAINPVPRQMIRRAVREATDRGLRLTISIPGGRTLAEKTFNPRLGVVGGLSILGTTGRVRPFSRPALVDALKCSVDVAAACGIINPIFVPGHIGERAARSFFETVPQQLIEVSNEWGPVLSMAARSAFHSILIVGHPGKLAKLADGQWDTHSSRSESAVPIVLRLNPVCGLNPADYSTVEGLFSSLAEPLRRETADNLSVLIRGSVINFMNAARQDDSRDVSVVLITMKGEWLGSAGTFEGKWERKRE